MKKLKLAEIAKRIDAHLRRFERDPKINQYPKGHPCRSDKDPSMGLHPYYHASAMASGRFVYVRYIVYQGQAHLTREKAEQYLAWLDVGNVGSHYKAARAEQKKAKKKRG